MRFSPRPLRFARAMIRSRSSLEITRSWRARHAHAAGRCLSSKSADKSGLAHTAIAILAALLGFSFFASPAVGDLAPVLHGGSPPHCFFKRIALRYHDHRAGDVARISSRSARTLFIPGSEHPGAGLGEFYSLPVFTCAGLMFMASAVDFILIFVSLELVTISFYVTGRATCGARARQSP